MGCLQGHYREYVITIGQYTISKQVKLAEGAYGSVWKCLYNINTLLALKEMLLQNEQLENTYRKQILILNKLKTSKSKYSIRLLDSQVENANNIKKGRMLLQFGTITLLDQISSRHFTEKEIIKILQQISLALVQLHKIGIIHLDLKPQNIILVDGIYKLCDFGSALTQPINYDSLDRRAKNNIEEYIEANATLKYRSPEMVEPRGQTISFASDMWMLGCVTYMLNYRRHPFENEGKLAILSNNPKYDSQSKINDLIKCLLNINPNERPSAEQFLQKVNNFYSD